MKEINVYGAKFPAVVTDEDYELVCQFNWYMQKGRAWTLIAGEPIEMAYLILHPWIITEPGKN
jgi:hypothetical protein